MSIVSGGSFINGWHRGDSSSQDFTTDATVAVGELAIVSVAIDDLSGSSTGETDDIALADDSSNTWTKAYEYTNSNGSTVAIFYSIISSEITSGEDLTVTPALKVVCYVISGEHFTLDESSVALSSTKEEEAASAGVGSLTVGSLTSKEYLWVRASAIEDRDTGFTTTSGFTAFTNLGTEGGGSSAGHQYLGAEYKIATGTTATSAPTDTSSSDSASVMIAISEVTGGGGGGGVKIKGLPVLGVG